MSFGLLIALGMSADLARLRAALAEADYRWLLGACGIVALIRVLMVFRWQILLVHQGFELRFQEVLRIVLIGGSVSQVTPGGIGGDVARVHQVVRSHGRGSAVVATILFDRVVGLFSLALLSVVAGVGGRGLNLPPELLYSTVGVFVAVVMGILALVIVGRRGHRISRWVPGRLLERALQVVSIAVTMRGSRKVMSLTLLSSITIQILRAMAFACVFVSFGVTLGWLYHLTLIPLVFVAMLAPFSVGGLGVREASLSLLYGALGVRVEVCIAVGLAFMSIQLLFALLGALLMLWPTHTGTPVERS